jgi:hypothetical protein
MIHTIRITAGGNEVVLNPTLHVRELIFVPTPVRNLHKLDWYVQDERSGVGVGQMGESVGPIANRRTNPVHCRVSTNLPSPPPHPLNFPELPPHSTSQAIVPVHKQSWTFYAMQLGLVRRNCRTVQTLNVPPLLSEHPNLIRSRPLPKQRPIDGVTYAAGAMNEQIISTAI